MDIGSVLLSLALLVLVGLFVSRPFLDRQTESQPLTVRQSARQRDQQRSALLAEKERILNALKELEFDHALGKIPEEDYPAQRTELMQSGVETLRKLDEMGETQQKEPALVPSAADAPRQPRATQPTPGEDQLEAMIAARRRDRQEKAVGFCHQCGSPLQKSDRFCPRCGADIAKP